MSQVNVSVEGNELLIRLPISPRPSGSGKTTVIAGTQGNLKTGVLYNGQEVVLGVNAYIYPPREEGKKGKNKTVSAPQAAAPAPVAYTPPVDNSHECG